MISALSSRGSASAACAKSNCRGANALEVDPEIGISIDFDDLHVQAKFLKRLLKSCRRNLSFGLGEIDFEVLDFVPGNELVAILQTVIAQRERPADNGAARIVLR